MRGIRVRLLVEFRTKRGDRWLTVNRETRGVAVPSDRARRYQALFDVTLDSGDVITVQGHYIVREDNGRSLSKAGDCD